MVPKAKAVWIRQLDAARQAQIAVIVEILSELDYLKAEAAELEPNLVAECVIRNVDLDGVIRDLEEAHDSSDDDSALAVDKVAVEDMPQCPKCGGELTVRVVKNGPRAGSRFLGCLSYPACMGTAPIPS
jgi:formate dehydrogenase maturation protein FdhE